MVDVVLIADSYAITETFDGATGTKKFITASALPSETPVTLPVIGASWDLTFTDLQANSIASRYISDDPSCGIWEYTVNYSTTPLPGDEDTLYPTTIEQSGEYRTYSDTKQEGDDAGHWVWPLEVDGATTYPLKRATELKRRIKEVTTTIVFHKWITDSDINDFIAESVAVVGKVNSGDAVLNGISLKDEEVLYTGFSASESKNSEGDKQWLCQLKFVSKKIPAPAGVFGGWNYEYRSAYNIYQKPYWSKDAAKLYQTADFTALVEF